MTAIASPDDISRARHLLTERQYEAWKLWITGLGYRRIATLLNIRPDTVRDHVREAQRKLDQ